MRKARRFDLRAVLARYNKRVDPSRIDAEGLGDERTPASPAQQTPAAASDAWWAGFMMLYVMVGFPVGWIAAAVTFIGVYVAAVNSAGWVIGIALGWIPAGIAAVILGWLVGLLWPILAIGIGVVIYKLATA